MIKVEFLNTVEKPVLPPQYKTEGSAGCDLSNNGSEHVYIGPGETGEIHTGLYIAIEPGFFGLIKERSSIARLGCFCTAGVIDSDYRGEVIVLLYNGSKEPVIVKQTERIANMIFVRYNKGAWAGVFELSKTLRGEGGFGSTGTGG